MLYTINENSHNLHNTINYIIDYMCNIYIDDDCSILLNDNISCNRDINSVVNQIIYYVCEINIPNYINLEQHVDLHSILNYLNDYTCKITINNSCINIPNNSDINTVFNLMADYLCNINLDYNCIFDEDTTLELHSLLNKLVSELCNINFKSHCFDIPSPNSLHNILNGILKYLCNITLKYDCFDIYDNIYNLQVETYFEKDSSGKVISSPIGINAPIDNNHDYISGTTVFLKAIPYLGSKFVKWENLTVNNDKYKTIGYSHLYDIFNKLLNYICNIYIYPTCLDISEPRPLNDILNKILEYVCVINLESDCIELSPNDDLHNILNKIIKYLCSIKLNNVCFKEDLGILYLECDTHTSQFGLHSVLHDIVDYLCKIPVEYNCVKSSDPASMHEIFNKIFEYICYIDIESCFVNSPTTVFDFFEAFDDYICNIPLIHCFDDPLYEIIIPALPPLVPPAPTTSLTTTPPDAPGPPPIITPDDYIMCFIDESENKQYADGNSIGASWKEDVNNWNTLNFDNSKIICFNVNKKSGGGRVVPKNPDPPTPIQNIITTKRNPSGNWIKNKTIEKWGNVWSDSSQKIVIFVDISGSMKRSTITPGLDDFIAMLACPFTEIQCKNERWIRWLYHSAKGKPGC